MKPITLLISAFCVGATALAAEDLPESGYYRCNNYMSSRYVYVIDNHGYIDMGASSADLNAIELWKGLDRAISDPATVLYFDHISNRQYDITCQGTGINQIIDYYVSLRAVSGKTNTYYFYATNSGITKYLCDGERVLSNDFGKLSDNGQGEWRYWEISRVSPDSENYFGITPDINCANGEKYASFFAAFPFSFNSEGMKAYYVSEIDVFNGIAVIEEAEGVFPGASPLIISCQSTSPSANKLNIGGTPTANLSNNLLQGIYFQNDRYKHENYLLNDKATMRVPALLADGTLGFTTYDGKYMPRNKAYLPVTAGTPETLKAMTPDEYLAWLKEQAAGIATTLTDTDEESTAIYNLTGIKVGDTREGTSSLAPGIYITNHKKFIVR